MKEELTQLPMALAVIQSRIQWARIEIAGLPRGSKSWREVRQKLEEMAAEQARLFQVCDRVDQQMRVMHEAATSEDIHGVPFHAYVDSRYPNGN